VREIGTLPKELDPRVFTDYLLTLGTTTRIDPSSEGWSVWVHNEDHVARARQELEAFVKDPNDPRYHDAKATAQAARRQEAEANRRFRKNFRDMSGSWDRPPAWRRRPVTITLIATSVAVYVLVWYAQPLGISGKRVLDLLSFTESGIDAQGIPYSHGLSDIARGEIWRLITPIFLHFNLLHILFNMWWLRDLGTLIELRLDSRTLALLVLVAAVVSNTGEFLWEASRADQGMAFARFGGMSGVVYALLGYVWVKGNRHPELAMRLHPTTVNFMLLWLVLCMVGTMGPIANAAHLVGLCVGIVAGLA
jgi:GlpG protein